MYKKRTCFASVVILFGLLSPLAIAQDFRYDFDGQADPGPGDFDEDGDVDGKDFLIWQLTAPLSTSDLTEWQANYGTGVVDRTDWMTTTNWSDGGFDPLSPLLPDFNTRVEIEDSKYGDNPPEIGPGDTAETYGVRIGRIGGEGLLTMSGGTLDIANACTGPFFNCNRRLRVGNDDSSAPAERNPGTFNLSDGIVSTDTLWIGSGSQGTMNMSGGVVNTRGTFYLDWTFDASSVLNMTGGTINVGTVTLLSSPLRLYRTSSLNLDGGEILVAGSAELGTETSLNPDFLQTPNVTVSITDGLLQADRFLQIGGTIVLDGGILRADSFNESLSAGTVDINGDGLLQFNNSQESVSAVEALITSGFFTTSEASPLSVDVVDVDGTDFTQVSVTPTLLAAGAVSVPEPSSVALALLAIFAVVLGRGELFRRMEKPNRVSYL
ncbi:MAG: hypothetical protein ABGX16_21005 [Pirellulales bacterium]